MLFLEHHAKQHTDWKEMPNVEEAAAIYHNTGLETVWNSALEEIDFIQERERDHEQD